MSSSVCTSNSTQAVRASKLELKEIDLNEQDPFRLENLSQIQKSRFEKSLEFYVCAVKEGEKTFIFEGSTFIEAFLRNGKKLQNPLTRNTIEKFEVLVSTSEKPAFDHFMLQDEVLDYPNYLPILWSDPDRLDSQLGEYHARMGIFLSEKGRVDEAIVHFSKAVSYGCREYYMDLAELFSKKDDVKKTEFYFKKAAFLGNYNAIYSLILFYEDTKQQKKVQLWRSVLPSKWQQKPMGDFLKHLDSTKYPWRKLEELEFPKELITERSQLDFTQLA